MVKETEIDVSEDLIPYSLLGNIDPWVSTKSSLSTEISEHEMLRPPGYAFEVPYICVRTTFKTEIPFPIEGFRKIYFPHLLSTTNEIKSSLTTTHINSYKINTEFTFYNRIFLQYYGEPKLDLISEAEDILNEIEDYEKNMTSYLSNIIRHRYLQWKIFLFNLKSNLTLIYSPTSILSPISSEKILQACQIQRSKHPSLAAAFHRMDRAQTKTPERFKQCPKS